MIINKAREFAILKHEGQMYGNVDYVTGHLDKVAAIAYKYIEPHYSDAWPVKQEIVAAAYLHDTLEDTDTMKLELYREFGAFITDIVWMVTDEPGANRKERKLNSYWKLRSKPEAIFVKLCDRLANVRSGGKLNMYRNEHYTFKAALWNPHDGLNEALWVELETALK